MSTCKFKAQLLILIINFLLGNAIGQFKTERPPYDDFLNYGIKKLKPDINLENEIIKSKVDVLGDVLKQHVNRLRKSPGQVVELVFLVDSSASVGAENFFNEIKFVKKLLADFTVSFNQTRVAVITFSSKSKVLRHIDHVTQSSPSNHKCSLLERELPKIGYSGGGTYTLGALMEAQGVLAISRPDAVKAVFLVTDGYSNGGDPRPAAEFLKSRGVIIFTFGIQNGNVKELYDMASTPKEEHSYILNSFQEFEALARRALHEDLHNGGMISQDAAACSTLCDERDGCCDEYARCTCGIHTGHYACTCRIGYYGTGLKGDCKPCPSGTYRDVEGPSDITGCKPCPDPNMLSSGGSTSPSQCYCKGGYSQTGLYCQRLKCPELFPPPNGYFVRGSCERALNAACGVRCRPGYTLEGSSIRLCREDSTWSGEEPTCIVKTCKPLKNLENGDMICSSETAIIDTECHFTCKPGFQLIGSRKRTCLPVAMWDGIRAYCRPIFCQPLPEIQNGIVKPKSCTAGKLKYGTRCEFGCNSGYDMSGPLKTVCTDKGMWSEGYENVRCNDVEPPIIKCPPNQEVETVPNENYALVKWDTPFVKDSSNGQVFVSTIPATKQPMKLKIGKHSIAFEAKDEWSNKAKCLFIVEVIDKEPPKVDSCESPPTFLSDDPEVDVYWEEPIFSDNSGGPLQVTRTREPGRFPQGKTLVDYVASDPYGNAVACNITITVQQHACELPLDPINGAANCSENSDAVYCSFTCENGYAFAMRPNQDYFCAYDGIWQPDNNPLPFPDCSVSSISNTISHSGEIAMEEDDDGSICDDVFFMGQIENKIQTKLEEALSAACVDELVCAIETVEAVCESLLAEVEEEFNSIGFNRKKRDISNDNYVNHYWPNESDSTKWMYWKRGTPLDFSSKNRMKRDTTRHLIKKRQFGFPKAIFKGKDVNETLAKKDRDANFMGVLTGLIVQSLGKDIGMTRFSSFLSSLGTKDGSFGVDDFLAAFSKEFGEEKAKDVRTLAEKSLGTIISDKMDSLVGNEISVEKGLHFASSSFSKFGGTVQVMDGEELKLDQITGPMSMAFKSDLMQQIGDYVPEEGSGDRSNDLNLPSTKHRGIKVKFQVEGQGNRASEVLGAAFKDLLKSAELGEFDIDFGKQQLKVAAIRLSEDPEYKCDPGSVVVDNLCVKCPIGTFFNVIFKECQPCPSGSYQPEEGQVSCLVCPENTSTKIGLAKSGEDCKAMCLPGSYSGDNLEPCITCPLGEYQDEYASSRCSSCPFGTTTWRRGSWVIQECKPTCPPGKVSETGLEPCLPCPRNYFQDEEGRTECLRCPGDAYTSDRNSTSLFDCIGVVENSKAAYTVFETLPINDCFSTPCSNGATCIAMESGYVCNCPLGYTGQHCESEVNECLSYPCHNNATCVDLVGKFTCECAPGFEGVLCDVNINECAPNPCENKAVCVDLVDSFKCICESGFTGAICATNIDECAQAPCSDGSTCIDGISDYTCQCLPGFEGRHCNDEINECDSAPCIHGICADLINDFRCSCEAGYTGKTCTEDINDCLNNPCQNNGTCSDWLNGFSCRCAPGFTGKTCDTKMSTDFILEFPSSGIINYASTEAMPKTLNEVTVCFWIKTTDKENYGTPFSYATAKNDNAFTFTDYSGFVLYVNDEKRITDVSATDGQWHMICVVWKAENGRWGVFKDGTEVDSGTGLSKDKAIEADGIFVIGQEQDERGGKYSAPESFIGEITLLNVWGQAIPRDKIKDFYRKCDRYDGDIWSWPDFQSGMMGGVKLKSSTFCRGCGVPSALEHGKFVQNGTDAGHVTRVVCDLGHKLYKGDKERLCLVHGVWSGLEPECRPVSCGFPPYLRNGNVKGINYDFGDALTISCNKGYRLAGSATRKCQADGKWDGETPECQLVQCPNPAPMENGKLISGLGSYLPTNKVAYSCQQGYQMDGPAYQTCGSSGNWEGNAPACQPKTCDESPRIIHGTVTMSESEQRSASVACEFGYTIEGKSKIRCLDNGEWETPFPKCVMAKCPKPPQVENGNVKIRVTELGKQAKYKCNTGYKLEGKKLLTCSEEGKWDTNEWSKCVLQQCSTPSIPSFGEIPEKEIWFVGDEMKYQCTPGYYIKGNIINVCAAGHDEGIWEGETPVCEEIYCPALHSVVGGSYSIIQNGRERENEGESSLSGFDEVELLRRRRRSSYSGAEFPSIGQSNDYKEFEDFGQRPSQQIHFPGQSSNPDYEDFGEVSKSTGQTSHGFNFDYTGQTSGGSDYNGQTSGGSDYTGQTSNGFDYTGQTSGGFDDFGQSTDGLDVFSQFPNYEEGGQSHGFDIEYSQVPQTPDSFIVDTFTYDTIVEYNCRPGYKLIGSRKRRCAEHGDWDEPEPRCYEQHCPELKPLVDGHLTYFGSGSSSRVEFHCNDGYKLSGDYEIVCQSDRTWLGNIPICDRLNCDVPLNPENGTVEYAATTFDSIATYDCFQGFVLEGSFTRHCGSDGFWNGSMPRCIGVVCKTPSVIDKGYIYYEGNLNVGSIVEYGCNECYKLVGNPVRECQLDESWSLEEPSCELIMCSELPRSLENGKVIGGSNSCGSLVEYECYPGYKLQGERKASCMEDGEWTSPTPSCERVSCGQPPKLSYGNIVGDSFKFKDHIEYQCNDGYLMNGNNRLTCGEDEKWIGGIPDCLIVNCTKPKGPSNGRVRVNGLFYRASVNIVCDPGYKIEGDSKLSCKANGLWDKEMPFCAPLICPPAPRPPHSFYNSTELYFESFTLLEYNCEEGYVSKANDTILKCSTKATWEGEVIDCKPVDCGKPNELKNGRIEGDKYTLGHVLDFFCFKGYKLIGETKSTCLLNGLWSDIPKCERITCKSPSIVPYSKVVMDEPIGDFNNSVHYECHNGYVLSGVPKLICQDNGEWSSKPPKCKPALCSEPPEELNANIVGDIYEFKHNITYECNEGFIMKGIPRLSCLENGKWSSDFPICEMIICDPPLENPNAKWTTKKLSEVPIRTEPLSAYKTTKKGKSKQKTKTTKTSKLTELLENQYENILYRFGHIIEYACDDGHFKTTSGLLECTDNGWSSPPPQCHPITCPLPIKIKNGRVIGDEVSFNSILRYECDEGYDLFGVPSRTCQASKEWTDIEPYCRPKECPRPAKLINGKTIVDSIKYQSVISYVCDPGFRLEGDETRICQSDENWSGDRPFCIEIFCNDPQEISHGITDTKSLKVGGQVIYSCMEGYKMEGKSILNCQTDGSWDSPPPRCLRIDCGTPPQNANLKMAYDSTHYASKVTYSCERGYQLEGPEGATCIQSGQWNNRAPLCNQVICDLLPDPLHGYLVKNNDQEVEGEVELFEGEELSSLKKSKKGKENTKSTKKGKQNKTLKYVAEKLYFVDDEITYQCNPGWKTVGNHKLVCTQTGDWSTPPPKCKRISCGIPEVSKHTKYYGDNHLFEGEVSFSCERGYILRGNPVIRCQEDGTWSFSSPVCEPLNCGPPPPLSNSHTSYQIPEHGLPHHFGSVVTFACNEGYLLEGSLFMTCEQSGKWIGPREPPACLEMLCGEPPYVTHSRAIEVKDSRSQIVTYTCEPGYILSGNDSIYCSLGNWKGLSVSCNPVNCYEPSIPPYGKITAENLLLGSIANYSCAIGYELKGNPSVECGVAGLWIGDTPRCQPIDCGIPEDPLNGKVSYGSSLYNQEAIYYCDSGYELKGEKKRTCLPSGSWSTHLPQCHRVSCGEIEPPSQGFIIGVGQLFGDEVKFSCEKGHVLIGNETSICQADGTWSVKHPKCEGVKCGPTHFIVNGDIVNTGQTNYVFGEKISYSCQVGHLPRGDLSSQCLKDGTWSKVQGQCSKISCGRPKLNRDGAVLLGRSFYYNDKLKIKCPSGTKPKGNTLITCLSDGSWSGEPSCVSGCNQQCLNGGVCLDDNVCSCPAGFMGKRCQHALCPLPCLNGGICTGPHRCTCLPGYAGTQCQTPICEDNCGLYGKCIGPNVCLCQSGETLPSCPELSDYDYYPQQIATQYDDWDIAALRRRHQRVRQGN